jgi:pyrophosphatase PpaX
LVDRYREFQGVHLEGLTTLYPGVRDFLDWTRARGHTTGIVTSKGKGMTDRSLRHVGIVDLFDTIVTYEDTERHKPGPEPVQLALQRLGVQPGDTIFLGDSPHDLHAGRAAGVWTAAALWGPFTRDELGPASPDWWLAGIGELRDIVADLVTGDR